MLLIHVLASAVAFASISEAAPTKKIKRHSEHWYEHHENGNNGDSSSGDGSSWSFSTDYSPSFTNYDKPTSTETHKRKSTSSWGSGNGDYSTPWPSSFHLQKKTFTWESSYPTATSTYGSASNSYSSDGSKYSATKTSSWASSTAGSSSGSNSTSSYFQYPKSEPILGVNLGGWLVMESWINTDLFSKDNFPNGNIPADEYNLVAKLGISKAGELLEKHYASWITEEDFKDIKSYGLNAVRIPIGYWAYKTIRGESYYKGAQDSYLQKAIGWARNHGLYVWIDLHGTPGSQNGYDNSGHKGAHDWGNGNNMDTTQDILKQIFQKYGGSEYKDVIIGIELVNEPLVNGAGVSQDKLSSFYSKAISNARNDVGMSQNIVLHDGYLAQGAWSKKSYTNKKNIIYDTHLYLLFADNYKAMNYDQKLKQVCEWGDQIAGLSYKEVVGEFTAAYQNGGNYLKGIEHWTSDDKSKMSRMVQAEFNAFERNYGWFFWNWKMINVDQWNFKKLVQEGVIPNPVTKRTYQDCKS